MRCFSGRKVQDSGGGGAMPVPTDERSSPHGQCSGFRDILCHPGLVAHLAVMHVPVAPFAIACMGGNVEAGFFVFFGFGTAVLSPLYRHLLFHCFMFSCSCRDSWGCFLLAVFNFSPCILQVTLKSPFWWFGDPVLRPRSP